MNESIMISLKDEFLNLIIRINKGISDWLMIFHISLPKFDDFYCAIFFMSS